MLVSNFEVRSFKGREGEAEAHLRFLVHFEIQIQILRM